MIVPTPPHITVCICTYKRPLLLARLLEALADQETAGRFTYSVVVADNDGRQSAEAVVRQYGAASGLPVTYCVEPRQNIPRARNKALEHASGDYVAFIDDDEFPTHTWLLTLFTACHQRGVDGVLGPVKRHFDEEPPPWIVKGRFYERPTYPTGSIIHWKQGRTGNVLLKRDVLTATAEPFRPECRTGEDQDFFRRMIARGHVFIWCSEAVAYEVVSPIRWKRTFMVRRALLQGTSALRPFGLVDIVKSLVAVPAYAAVLPLVLVLGQHRFMAILIKLCDHLGRLFALVGIRAIREPYVTE
jgi:glycosyltransferase involved in cell wall biosynthesis